MLFRSKPLKKLQFRVPATSSTNYNDSYYARIVFTTTKGFKLIQPDTVYLEGVDCKNGVLLPKANTTYIISVYYNPDTTISDKAYLGSVGAKKKGSNYAQPLFKYSADLVKIANSSCRSCGILVSGSVCSTFVSGSPHKSTIVCLAVSISLVAS